MRLSLFAVAALCVVSIASHADTVYTYTGQYFTDVSGPYTTSDRVTGSFTVATPFGDNLSNYSFVPESFSFTDGVQTLTQNNTFIQNFSDFSTDSSGNLTSYAIGLAPGGLAQHILIQGFVGDVGEDGSAAYGYSYVGGSLTTLLAVTPEPSSFVLFGTGLLGVVGMFGNDRPGPEVDAFAAPQDPA